MIVQVLFAFALFVPALCCSGGVGDRIIQNPTFSFDFNPPMSWTWYTPNGTLNIPQNYPGQASTQADALRYMKNSIDGAILNSAQKLGYSTIGMTWTITGYNPQMMYVVDEAQAASTTITAGSLVGSYVPGLGAVLSQRGTYTAATTSYAKIDFFNQITINVRGSALYTKSQWQNFADQVFTYLSIYEKVKFRGPVNIN